MAESEKQIPRSNERPIEKGQLEYKGEINEIRNRDIPEISRKTTVYQPIEDTTGPAPKGSNDK